MSANAELLRRLRAAAVAAGNCIECRCRRPDPGKKSCETCLARGRNRAQRYRAAGLCDCGRTPEPGKKSCTLCLDAQSARLMLGRAVDKAQGICATQCCSAPVEPGKASCTECLKQNAARRARNQRALFESGLCLRCRAPNQGHWHCPLCQAKVNAADRARAAARRASAEVSP